jgi:NTE family protein
VGRADVEEVRVRLGLVLSGGGANGAFEAGVIAAMEELGLAPTILSGTSAGALNAAALAHGLDAAALSDVWRRVRARDVYRLRRDVWRAVRPRGWLSSGNLGERALEGIGWSHLLDTAPLAATLERTLGGRRIQVPADKVLALSAVEKASGQLVRFTSSLPPPHRTNRRFREAELTVDHLLASAAIPLAFAPAELDGQRWWDGGIVANTPLAPAMAYEPAAIVVVTTATRERPAPRPESLGQSLGLLVDNILAFSLDADLKHARLVNELCRLEPDRPGVREVELLVIEPTGLDLGGALDFSAHLADRRLEAGLEVGRRELADWLA